MLPVLRYTACYCLRWLNNNNINNNRDDIYGAVIMAKPLWEFTHFIWWMQTQRRGGRQPSDQANRLGLWARQKWQLPSASTIAIYYYSALKLILILPSHGGWKAESTIIRGRTDHLSDILAHRKITQLLLFIYNFRLKPALVYYVFDGHHCSRSALTVSSWYHELWPITSPSY